MKYLLAILFFHLLLCKGFSQKETSQTFDAQQIRILYVFADEVSKIHLKTTGAKVIVFTSKSTGEYYNEIGFNLELQPDKMIISSRFKENLQGGYDKLSAHKVFSMEIFLEVPQDMQVIVTSNSAQFTASGKYKYLEAELNSGACRLNNFTGNALVNTYKGAISLQTKNAVINASSRNGQVILPKLSKGIHNIELHSINGDILVQEN